MGQGNETLSFLFGKGIVNRLITSRESL